MKNKYWLLILFCIGIVVVTLIVTREDKEDIPIKFDESEITTPSAVKPDILVTPSITNVVEKPTPEVTVAPTPTEAVEEDNSFVSGFEITEVAEKLVKLDKSTISVLNELPLERKFRKKLEEKGSVIPTVSSGSKISFLTTGVSEDGSYLFIFGTQTSTYYLILYTRNDKIYDLMWRELY